MRPLIGVLSVALIATLLAEFFVVFLLPRRVKRDPRIARTLLRSLWTPWRRLASGLPPVAADTALGIFGPFGLLAILGVLSLGMIVGFAGLLWAASTHLGPGHRPAGVGGDLYYSAGAFFSASIAGAPRGWPGKVVQIMEAAAGFSFLAIAIGYLPALFQAFSRRETAVSRLDPRAGSPPTASALLASSAARGGWSQLDEYLSEWEVWSAELMETHLSYPVLGYFRSQHVNQNWLAALITVVDSCAYAVAYGPQDEIAAARLTFRIGRHALADLAHAYSSRRTRRMEGAQIPRLSSEDLVRLHADLEHSGLHSEGGEAAERRLHELRFTYEHYAAALASHLALDLPGWISEGVSDNWRTATDRGRARNLLP